MENDQNNFKNAQVKTKNVCATNKNYDTLISVEHCMGKHKQNANSQKRQENVLRQ